jgi:hypothetical protein
VLGDRPPAYADLEQLPYLQVGVMFRAIMISSLLDFDYAWAAAGAGGQGTFLLTLGAAAIHAG